MDFISADPHVLNLVHLNIANKRFHGSSVGETLTDGLSTMEAIFSQLTEVRDSLCEPFPRLWFLSNWEVMELLSNHPTPSTLLPFVRKLFRGVRWLDVDGEDPSDTAGCNATCPRHRQAKVVGVFGSLQEHVRFLSPPAANHDPVDWLCVFEKQFKSTMEQLTEQCTYERQRLEPLRQDVASSKTTGVSTLQSGDRSEPPLPVLEMVFKYPLQCLLVAEEAVWHSAALQAFQTSSPVKLGDIRADTCAKLGSLGQCLRGRIGEPQWESVLSKYTMMCLRALVQITVKHSQQLSRLMQVRCEPESSFEWLSFLKYHVTSQDQSRPATGGWTLCVDVLGHRLQYGWEYVDPEDWTMVHTPSTDRAIVGILLALTSYRCGFVSGPCLSGKTKTVVHLAKALGRQVVSLQCCPAVRLDVVGRMLCGALSTGAWLLVDSVDVLTQRVHASLAQQLEDIHQSFSAFTRKDKERVSEEQKDRTTNDPRCCVVFAGKSISANLNYGCILTSSKRDTSELPQSLRLSTRPVALTHPDSRIIAEVMLTSSGFSEASSLSQRLVSLISLAKDSVGLPSFMTKDPSGCLLVLQKIISASEEYLHQSVKERAFSDKTEGSAARQSDRTSPTAASGCVERDAEEALKAPRWHRTHSSITQGLLEEVAIVKAIDSVLSPIIYGTEESSQFDAVLKATFPIQSQFPLFKQHMDGEENKQLKEAVTAELEREQLQSDTEIICNALKLYQSMKSPQVVVLVGPPGSGKTTCCSVLAGALNTLTTTATKAGFENANVIVNVFVDTLVFFPNAMCHEEIFGCFCEKGGWQDGAVAKVLRDSERQERTRLEKPQNKTGEGPKVVKWLIMDGEPVGQPAWLDYLVTLSNPQNPCLCLSSGEMLLPSRWHARFLTEVTDLSDASPCVVARCSLVYFTGTDLWKAVWKSEIDFLHCKHRLNQGALKVWVDLADDLFSSTLSLLKEKAIPRKGESFNSSPYGLQEITSFVRILRAFLLHFGKELRKAEGAAHMDIRGQGIDTTS